MKNLNFLFGVSAVMFVAATTTAQAEQLLWGIQAEQLEYRLGEADENIFAWDFDAFVGSDEVKVYWRSEAEYDTKESSFETLENQLRLQMPISDFFDGVIGVRADTPKGPDRYHGVVGVHGLTRQWFEIDADLFVSDHPSARFEVEYEGLITNRVIFTPSVELDMPFTDDREIDIGAWGPKAEIGARLSYDLVDRAVAPYIGVHYERVFGETSDIRRANGKEDDAVFFVTGVRLVF